MYIHHNTDITTVLEELNKNNSLCYEYTVYGASNGLRVTTSNFHQMAISQHTSPTHQCPTSCIQVCGYVHCISILYGLLMMRNNWTSPQRKLILIHLSLLFSLIHWKSFVGTDFHKFVSKALWSIRINKIQHNREVTESFNH